MTVAAPVDSRADRTVQALIAVIVLAAFVFRQIWILPVLGVLVGAGAAFGPQGNPLHRLFAAWVAPRLPAARSHEEASALRVQDAFATALLALATLAMVIGLNAVAWIIALVEAGVAAVAATTGVHLGVMVRDRIRRR